MFRANPYQPEQVAVVARDGKPVVVQVKERRQRVRGVINTWRIDEEWWRKLISRLYFLLELESGIRLTVFQDLESGGWYRQNWVEASAKYE
jgi:hypothetical protein